MNLRPYNQTQPDDSKYLKSHKCQTTFGNFLRYPTNFVVHHVLLPMELLSRQPPYPHHHATARKFCCPNTIIPDKPVSYKPLRNHTLSAADAFIFPSYLRRIGSTTSRTNCST